MANYISKDYLLTQLKNFKSIVLDPFFMKKDNPIGTGSFSMNRYEGSTIANYSTTLGNRNIASNYYSLATGLSTEAKGDCASTFGHGTIAGSPFQMVCGQYNEEDTRNTYAFIIGGGDGSGLRKDILNVDWFGNVLANDFKAYNGKTLSASLTSSNLANNGGTILTTTAGNAVSATKATQDGNGNIITSTYLKKTDNAASATKATQDGNGQVITTTYLKANANAVSATKATQDGSGNVITSTYLKKSESAWAEHNISINSTNVSDYSGYCRSLSLNGKTIIFFRARYTRKATFAANKDYELGKIASAAKPSIATALSVYAATSNLVYAYVDSAGAITIRTTGTAANPNYFYVAGIWMV